MAKIRCAPHISFRIFYRLCVRVCVWGGDKIVVVREPFILDKRAVFIIVNEILNYFKRNSKYLKDFSFNNRQIS